MRRVLQPLFGFVAAALGFYALLYGVALVLRPDVQTLPPGSYPFTTKFTPPALSVAGLGKKLH